MSKFRKLGQFLGLVDEYDYEEERPDYEGILPPRSEGVEASRPATTQPSRPTSTYEGVRVIPSNPPAAASEPARVLNLPSAAEQPVATSKQIKMITPMVFNDAEKIGVDFRTGHPVLINLHETTPELSRRLIDFLSGVVLALNGRMQKASAGVILILPAGYEISAMQQQEITSGHFFNQG